MDLLALVNSLLTFRERLRSFGRFLALVNHARGRRRSGVRAAGNAVNFPYCARPLESLPRVLVPIKHSAAKFVVGTGSAIRTHLAALGNSISLSHFSTVQTKGVC